MAIKFNPKGYLNISSDPMDLPEELVDKSVVSGAMTRCKNLDLSRPGLAKTRNGSSLKTSSVLTETINHLQMIDEYRYEFGGDQIFRNESSLATSLNSANWHSFVYYAYNETSESIFATNGVNRKRIQGTTVSEWGIEAPTAAPNVTGEYDYAVTQTWEKTYLASGKYGRKFTIDATNYQCTYSWEHAQIDGDTSLYEESYLYMATAFSDYVTSYSDYQKYGVKITYARYDGTTLLCESNPSDAAYTNIKSGLLVTWSTPSDTQITHIRVYRTLAGFEDYYYADEFEIADGYGVIFTKDEELGSEVSEDHDRPPLNANVVAGPDFNGVSFLAVGNYLYYSKPKQPEYWPSLYNVECGNAESPIKALAFLGGQLYAANEQEIYQIQGSGNDSFFPLPMAAVTGTKSGQVFLPVKGYGIFHLGYDGLYIYTASQDMKITDSTLKPIFQGATTNGINGINLDNLSQCILVKYGNSLWFGYPGLNSQYCDNFFVVELESNILQGITGKVLYYTFPFSVTAIFSDNIRHDLLVTDTSGYVWKLEDSEKTDDNGTAIPWEIESKSFGALRKYFPRWARYDVDLSAGATANGYILLNDVAKQTHTITESRKIIKRLIGGYTGDRVSVRLSGTGAVTLYSAEIE